MDQYPTIAVLRNLYVTPSARGRGVVKQLIETQLAWCRSTGVRFVYAGAYRSMPKLLSRFGFCPLPQWSETTPMAIDLLLGPCS